MKVIIFFTFVVAVYANQKFSYNGYRLLRLYPAHNGQIELIQTLELADNDFDIWNTVNHESIGKSVDILLPPTKFNKYKEVLNANKIQFEVVDENIQNKIDEQLRSMIKTKQDSISKSIIFKYARYSEILNFIDDTVAGNSDIASSYIPGKTTGNRDLKVIKIKTSSTASRNVWIDCGIHAREWVAPASCVYIIDRLISEYRASEPTTKAIFDKYEIHILPLVNPDGYEYSHTTSRLWRKNRETNTGPCVGTDLNRNFPFKWRTGGSSTDTCSDTYAGKSAGSSLETQAIIKAIQDNDGKWDAFLSVHSYGHWWLTQWGHNYTRVEKPVDYDDLITKAQFGVDAIKAYNGSVFVSGASSDLLYINSGSSADWAKGEKNIKYSYVLELSPGPGTPDYRYGFTLPEDRMTRVAPECFIGIKAFIKSIL